MNQPLTAIEARKLAREILVSGTVVISTHARKEMDNDKLTAVDITNVLRGGSYNEAEWENGGWRHQVSTQRIVVVIEFDSETEVIIVTAWRRK